MTRFKNLLLGCFMMFVCSLPALAAGPTLNIGTVSGSPGQNVTVPITLTTNGASVVAVSLDIGYDPAVLTPIAIAPATKPAILGAASIAAGKSSLQNQVSAGVYRLGVVSFTDFTPFGNGVVATISFAVAAHAPVGALTLINTPTATDPIGNQITVSGTNGTIYVVAAINGTCGTSNGGTFTTTPNNNLCSAGTPSVVTGSGPWNWTCAGQYGGTDITCTAQKLHGKPGDSNGDGTVTIAEVQSSINMFLGTNTVHASVDTDSSGGVSIAEVQKVINGFLGIVDGGDGGTLPVASANVGVGGYTFNISSADANLNNLSLEIPAGALSGNATISIKTTNCPSSVTEKANDYCLLLEPSGLVFSKPVKLTLPYTRSSDIQDLVLVTYNETASKWEKVTVDSINTANKTVTASITHFSIWTVMSNLFTNNESGNYFDSTLYKNPATGGIAAKSVWKILLGNTYLNWRSSNNTALSELLNGYAYSSHSPYYVYSIRLYKKGFISDSELSTVRFYVYPQVYYSGGSSYKFAIVDSSGKRSFSDEYVTTANADPWYQNKNFTWDFMCSDQPCVPDDQDTEYYIRTKLVIVDGKSCADSLIAGAYCNSSVVDGAVISHTFTNRTDTLFKAPLALLPTSTCSSFTYSSWGACQSNSTQTRTVTSSSPSGCTGGSPVLSQACAYAPPTCSSFTYSGWGACQSNSTQTRTVTSSSPSGCTGGSPVLSQACTYAPPTCTSFTYSGWGACQSNNTQTRTVTSSSPSGCTGGSPLLSQTCTYNPGPKGDPSFILTWSYTDSSRAAGPDIDIWVTDPLGHTLSSSRKGYQLGPDPEGGVIDIDNMGGWCGGNLGANTSCTGGGPERLYWPTGQAPTGTYTYGIRYFDGDGTVNYTLTVYRNQNVLTTKTGVLSSKGNEITLGTINNESAGGGDTGSVSLPKTGQIISYGPGDDGALQKGVAWPNSRFTDNGNGTVTDNLTGLIWLKNANCFGNKHWSQALASANALATGACGLTDGSTAGQWRLPNIVELESLVDVERFDPALPAGHPFSGVSSRNGFWSSSTVAGNTDFAWLVGMLGGEVYYYFDKSDIGYVWPVSGGK